MIKRRYSNNKAQRLSQKKLRNPAKKTQVWEHWDQLASVTCQNILTALVCVQTPSVLHLIAKRSRKSYEGVAK